MEEEKRIGVGLGLGFLIVGIITDFLQFILTLLWVGVIINPVLDIIAGGIFWVMMYAHGGKLTSRRSTSLVATWLIEFIPVLNMIPAWTMYAVYLIFADRIKGAAKKALPGNDMSDKAPRRGWRL